MIFKNLLRRKGRTLLTILGIAIGVAAIVSLGAMADGVAAGYGAVLTGADADLTLSEPDMVDITLSAVDETIGPELAVMPEVAAVSGMLQGVVQAEDSPYFFVFGYPEGSFALARYRLIDGVDLYSREAAEQAGRPLLLGSAAAEAFHKEVGDIMVLTDSSFRVVGIYETGDAFEEGGAVLRLEDAQNLLGLQRQVSLFYIQLEPGADQERLENRVARKWPDLSLSRSEELADQQMMGESLQGMMWAVAGLSIVIGGVGMMNAQLMSVFERTREIGVLRAVGWQAGRVLSMILAESLMVSLLGGLLGAALGWLSLLGSSGLMAAMGASATSVRPGLLVEALIVVLVLGLVGGIYPAWRAARLQPVEALRYEGGSGGSAGRLPVGGLALQGLWRRKARSLLTLTGIAITVGAIMALDSLMAGMVNMMTSLVSGAEIVLRQAGASDTGYAFIDERIGERLIAMPEIKNVSGLAFTALAYPETTYFVIQGYNPHEAAIQDFNVVEGERLTANRQIMLGRQMAEATGLGVGDSITLGPSRFRVVGIYESSIGWVELGGIVSLRDAQGFTGKPGKVTFFLINLHDPRQAQVVVEKINAQYPEVHAALSGEFANEMPDMENTRAMLAGISILAVAVGGVGMMNTMLMAVLERTREIGVLRALGWRRLAILSLILRESLWLGVLGGAAGVGVALGIQWLIRQIEFMSSLDPVWSAAVLARALGIALGLGLIGGLYPALRATRLQPVEALRYE